MEKSSTAKLSLNPPTAARVPRRALSPPRRRFDKELDWKAEYALEDIIFNAWKRHSGNVKEIQRLLLKECCQREAELPVFINQSVLKSNLLSQ
ncbi:hypothetical protein BDD39_000392 [Saccharococcus thermophilus]|uniref:Uncharacterized protein n=1 Tax=Saccharococcus thermophilus TaxID=29396 RepID=A0A846MBD5_9BACL|nr:hypothetical protein [Saccharococcus thermophilus]